jgi:stearoyl-CoA desaturase (delta-9 desaturase)
MATPSRARCAASSGAASCWLALPSLGEAWHHNHHAFPRSASHGLRSWELDPSGLVIRAMRRLGLAWNVVSISPERQQAKLQGS